MVFTATDTSYMIDGIEVPQVVYDTLLPSKLFPIDTGMSLQEAMDRLDYLKGIAPPLPDHKGPYFALAIDGAHPVRSDALAVHSKQIPQVVARNKRHGLSIEYDKIGRPVFTDAGQRRKLMKIEGYRKMNSAYGY